MNLTQLIEQIESSEFDCRFSVLSGFRTVLNGFEFDETVQSLIQELRIYPSGYAIINARLLVLRMDYRVGYWHNRDIPLCAYLYALHEADCTSDMFYANVEWIAKKKETFWAKRMALKIIEDREENV